VFIMVLYVLLLGLILSRGTFIYRQASQCIFNPSFTDMSARISFLFVFCSEVSLSASFESTESKPLL
jgi:hypothetical protein